MIQTSEQINEISGALAKAQLELENVERSGTNPHFRSRYAQLGAVLEEARAKLAKHNVAIVQAAVNGEGSNIGIVTRLAHSSGQWIESTLYVAPTKFDAQGAGSVISYLRRYALMAMVGLAPDDDDAEAAVGRPQARPQTTGATRTASTPPAPERPALAGNAALPAHPEENPETTAARQRVRMLIDQYDQRIKKAPHKQALELTLDDGRDDLAEIEAAGERGKAAAQALRNKATTRMAEFDERAA